MKYDSLDEIRKTLVAIAQKAYRRGLFTGTSGNLSIFHREEEIVCITPTSTPYEAMTAEDVVLLSPEGTVLSGGKLPSSEWRMHLALYQAMPEISSVFHTHSPFATTLATLRRGIPNILAEMQPFLGGGIRVARWAAPGTAAMGEYAARALEGRGGCLLASHGTVAVGATVEEALLRSEYLEEAAMIYYRASLLGIPTELEKEVEK